jgi:hypothetical protein
MYSFGKKKKKKKRNACRCCKGVRYMDARNTCMTILLVASHERSINTCRPPAMFDPSQGCTGYTRRYTVLGDRYHRVRQGNVTVSKWMPT